MTLAPSTRIKAIARRAAIPVGMLMAFLFGGVLLGENDGDQARAPHAVDKDVKDWTCSMHPQVRASEPGKCPICGMDLIPVGGDSGATVSLSESAKIRAKIRTTQVKRRQAASVERRLLGRVDYDETRLRTVTSWIGGRIDRLQVKTTGQRIKQGQVIATLYSPEIFGAHQDLLVAKQQAAKLRSATEGARLGADAILNASRDRLRLLGVPAAEITAMESAKKPSEQIRIRSPFGGTVIERLATEGSYVKTGTGLYQVADLSRLWVQLDAYESDLSVLKIAQEVSLNVDALPSEEFTGRVTFIDPVLNQRTRTTRVRIEVKNTNGQLRPNMFAEAVVSGTKGDADSNSLVIPDTAPLFTGRRSIVYVEVPGAERPTYQARIVRLGQKTGDVYPVIAGLSAGENIVIHGAFTLDADLQIRGGQSMMTAPDDTGHGPYDKIVEIPSDHKPALGKLVVSYLAVHEALASDNLEAAQTASTAIARGAEGMEAQTPEQFATAWLPLRRQLINQAHNLSDAPTLEEARPVFRDLSHQIATLLRVFGNPTKDTVRLASCPMALNGEGAEWVQRASHIENPYFGASMHSCGQVHTVVEHGTYLPLQGGTEKPGQTPGQTPTPKAPAQGHQH